MTPAHGGACSASIGLGKPAAAAAALGRTYPGGLEPFVAAMNAKAASLDMKESRFVDRHRPLAQRTSPARANLVEAGARGA